MKRVLVFLFLLFSPLFVWSDVPSWMKMQIEKDLDYFKDKQISLSEMQSLYAQKGEQFQLVKYTIENNQVLIDKSYVDFKRVKDRVLNYFDALTLLCKTKGLPNTTLLISINDGLNAKEEIPIFAMCKIDSDRILLLPDYEALGSRFQVLKTTDVTQWDFPWEEKQAKLIWRGSTAQLFLKKVQEKDLPLLSRLKLCELSAAYPEIIDAKFTIFTQGGQDIPYFRQFEGDRLSFEEQMNYKYHILIDGNTCAYSKSGWKLFTNSVIFKPDSKWVQWYYEALRPFVHYIPVEGNLSNLMENLQWALDNDLKAKEIASNCRTFALTHLTFPDHLLYLHQAILRYNDLNFVP